MSAVKPSTTGAQSRMNGMPPSSRRSVGKKSSGVRNPRNAVRSPNEANGSWKPLAHTALGEPRLHARGSLGFRDSRLERGGHRLGTVVGEALHLAQPIELGHGTFHGFFLPTFTSKTVMVTGGASGGKWSVLPYMPFGIRIAIKAALMATLGDWRHTRSSTGSTSASSVRRTRPARSTSPRRSREPLSRVSSRSSARLDRLFGE